MARAKAKINVIRAGDLAAPRLSAVPRLLKLDLGGGDTAGKGFEDYESVDICKTSRTKWKVDLFKFPWPWKNDSVEAVYSQHFFEHVPAKLRPKFMDELYRVMVNDGKAVFVTPYWSSMRAVQDFTHEWPPICEASFAYFNEEWRRINHLEHYGVHCNFDFTYGFGIVPQFQSKNDETRGFACGHYVNSVADIIVNLTKKPRLKKVK